MVNNRTRDNMKGTICSKTYNFVFEWSLANRHLPPAEAILRVYMQSRDNRFPISSTMPVNVSARLQADNTTDEQEWTFLGSIDVEKNSTGWLEFSITEPLINLWNSATKQAIVNIELKFDVNCSRGDKMPLKLTNPVAWRLDKGRRVKTSGLQPFLVISSDDIHIKRAIARNNYMPPSEEEPTLPVPEEEEESERRKRNSANHICRIEDFNVTFSHLGIKNILRPVALNVRQCAGSCSIYYAPHTLAITTNHARLLTSAANILLNGHESPPNSFPPKNPCCSPTSYFPAYLLIAYPLELKLYSQFIVKECGCR
jgi:hypothetical protein